MELGLIGLGKMGYNLALNLRDHGFSPLVFDLAPDPLQRWAAEAGVPPAADIADLVHRLAPPRILWIMVPAGSPTDAVLRDLLPHLAAGDIIIDGGNAHYRDTQRRALELQERGVFLLDCGTSGGTEGARHGACTMIGGDVEAWKRCAPVFEAVSLPGGTLHVGPSGAGHFAKMVHNGIEYGMMQAIAEGFEVLEKSNLGFNFQALAELWNTGSVIRGWLMALTARAFSKDRHLDAIRGRMYASGEGRWTVETAFELGVPTPVIALSFIMRQRSLQDDTFAGKVVAALRNEFGGHMIDSTDIPPVSP